MSTAVSCASVSATPNIDSVIAEINELPSITREEPSAISLRDAVRKELDCKSPHFFTFFPDQMGVCDVVFETAKQRVIVAEYQRSITEQQIQTFSREIQRMATKDESGNSYIMIMNLYKILSHSPPEVRECFKCAVINQLIASSNSSADCISCQLLADFLLTCCRRSQQRLLLQSIARSTDYITSNDFLEFVMTEISCKLSWENGMKDCPFYYAVFVERCVFFQFDPQRSGKISILELTSTRLLDDLFEVISEQKREISEKSWDTPGSWCSISRFWRILEQFRICDKDGSGMVSLEECRRFKDSTITPLFLERVFANQTLYGDQPPQEMDFRGFVDLDVAITTRNQPASIRWLFRVLDLRDDGVLDRDEIKLIIQSMLENLSTMENWPTNFNADDIVDEIIDMLNPVYPNRILVDDMIASNMAETALGILIDYVAFLKYENREEETAA